MIETSSKLPTSLELCQHYLLKVSRTFALNIGFLKHDAYTATLCGYLFCRIIDTIEDSTVLSAPQKIDLLQEWNNFFGLDNYHESLSNWQNKIRQITQSPLTENLFESELIQDANHVFSIFATLPEPFRQSLIPWVKEMADGMTLFQRRFHQNADIVFQLEDLGDLEKYCYYVAGTVGEFLKEIMFHSIPGLTPRQKEALSAHAVPFGLGLQLTNILKDIQVDAGRNWCYIPKTLLTLSSTNTGPLFTDTESQIQVYRPIIDRARLHLNKALEYCLALPRFEKNFRLFCLIPLKLAIQTLNQLESDIAHTLAPKTKINRRQVAATLWHSRLTYFSNSLQTRFCISDSQ